jgi:hypothetical protein
VEYLAGFDWPVPRAFAAAVTACRFEQGDVLYSHRSAYGRWAKAQDRLEHRIQVLEPAKTTRALGTDADGNRFQANWESPVELDLLGRDGEARRITTTQGRLFSCLWQGAVSWLSPDSEPPVPPALSRDLHTRLAESLSAFRKHFSRAGVDDAAWLYLWVVDQASDTSRVKAARTERGLADRYSVTSADLAPGRARIETANGFHPALVLRGLAIEGATGEVIEETLKGLLYAPGEDREGKADRFSLSRHGLLERLVPQKGVEGD